jgi:hypothetical protein
MSELTPDELIAKYKMDNPPEPDNAMVRATLDGKRLVAAMFNRRDDLPQLFDPTRCREMYEIASQAHRDLRAAMAAGVVEYVDASNDPHDPDDVDDAAILVSFVGSEGVCVVRAESVDMFAAMYKATWQVTVRRASPARCAVKIAPVCDVATANGRSLEYWPYLCGQILLMFPICGTCRAKAVATSETNFRFSEIAAYERMAEKPLPVWARTAPWWLRWQAAFRRRFRHR